MKVPGQQRVKALNLIGRQVGRLRNQRGWSQESLSDRLQFAGWMISRSGVSKIERGLIYVHDFQLFYLAHVFRVQISTLFPAIDPAADVHETLLRFIRNEKKRSMVPEPEAEPDKSLIFTQQRSSYAK